MPVVCQAPIDGTRSGRYSHGMQHRNVILFAALLELAGCAVISGARLVGTWSGTVFWFDMTYELRSGGALVATSYDGESTDTSYGTWTADYSTLTLDFGDGDPSVFTYELDGDTLLLTAVGGLPITIQLTRS